MEVIKIKGYNRIWQVSTLQKEFKAMCGKKDNGNIKRYIDWLNSSLAVLDEYGDAAIRLEGFEVLSGVSPKAYSIRYPKSKKNTRVLYVIECSGRIILLAARRESDASDYNGMIALVKNRAKILHLNI